MDKKYLFIRYGGIWDDTEEQYTRGRLKGILVLSTLTFVDLVNLVYDLTQVSLIEFNIIMRVKYKLDIDSPSVFLMDDADIQFLLSEYDCGRPQIFVNLKERHQEVENGIRFETCVNEMEDKPMCE